MSLTEQTRLRLHQYLEGHMGHDLAGEIMEWLPRGDLATKDDIEALRVATKTDIEALRLSTKAEVEGLRAEMKADVEGLRAEMKSEFASVRGDIALVRAEIALTSEKTRADLYNTLRLQTIVLVGALGTLGSIARIF